GSDACVMGIRTWAEAEADPHNVARDLFYRDEADVRQPAPAPRFADLGGASWAGAADAVASAGTGAAAGGAAGEGSASSGAGTGVGAGTDAATSTGDGAAGAGAGAAAGAARPVRGGGEPYTQPAPAPRVGEHTEELLASAGLTADEVAALRDSGALG